MLSKQGSFTQDSSLAYFVNQLDNLDRNLYLPLVSTSFGRDIRMRPGITMSDESTSFIQSSFGAPGSLSNPGTASNGGNMPFVSPETTAIPGISIDGQRIVLPLRLLAREVSYASIELERSQKTGQPIDAMKLSALQVLYNMNIDQMVYIGATEVSATGLVNDASITSGSVAAGVSGSTLWNNKTPDEMLKDVNTALETAWAASGYAVCPGKCLLPPYQFSLISSQKVSSAGNVSILKFLKENSISLQINGRELDIAPVKWLTGRGSAGADRFVVYTNELDRVRFSMVPIRRETPYYMGMKFISPYSYLLGQIEFVYPECVLYQDGI